MLILLSCCPKQTTTIETTKVLQEIRRDTIFIKSQPIIKYVSDSIIQTKPFIFRIDTVLKTIYQNRVKTDTIKIKYSFPNNEYEMSIKTYPDSIFSEIRNEIKTIVKEKSFFDRILDNIYIILGLILLIIVGFIIIIKK